MRVLLGALRHFSGDLQIGIDVANIFKGAKPKTHEIRRTRHKTHVGLPPFVRKLLPEEMAAFAPLPAGAVDSRDS